MNRSFLFCFVFILGCSQVEPEKVSGDRIISLSPSITSTIMEIGCSDLLVGRSSFCKTENKGLPVVGDLYEIDYERLLSLQPTKVLVQETAGGVDRHLKELAEKDYFSLHSWEINRFADIAKLHDDLLQMLDIDGESLNLELEPIEISLPSPILIMTSGSEGTAGLCFGKLTYLDDLLTFVGGENALQQSGWLSLSLEDILNLNPATIIMVSDAQFTVPAGVRSLDIPTIQFIHEDVLIPSSKIVGVAEEFRENLLRR